MGLIAFLSTFLIFFTSVEARSELCFYGGWPSIKKKNKCLPPWNNKVEKKYKHMNLLEDEPHKCKSGYFQCNPLLFGKTCMKWNRRTDYNEACAKNSPPSFHARALLNDPSALGQHMALLNLLESKCKDESSKECDILSSHVVQVKDQIIQQTTNICRVNSKGELDIGDFYLNKIVNVISKLEILSNLIPPPEKYNELNLNEKVIFNNFTKLKGNPKAFFHAMCFYKKNKTTAFEQNGGELRIDTKNCNILINDYTKTSSKKRFYSLNICTGEVLVMPSSHGKGGGKGNPKNDKGKARHFSDTPGTNMSPTGFLIIGQEYRGRDPWKPGIKLHGLQKEEKGGDEKSRHLGNRNTYGRGVVLHKSKSFKGDYCKGTISSSKEKRPILNGDQCGRTAGCLGVPSTSWDYVYKNLKGKEEDNGLVTGPLLYTFGPKQANKSINYCGGDNLWKK